jgi:hypothetical protein
MGKRAFGIRAQKFGYLGGIRGGQMTAFEGSFTSKAG